MSLSKTIDVKDLNNHLKKGQRLLCLDVGTKTIGVAISNSELTIATPISIITRKNLINDVLELNKIIFSRNIGILIIGLPVNMNGSEGPKCQSVRQFVKNISKSIELDIIFWDERLSTKAVEKLMIANDTTRAKRKKQIDKEAASFILQGLLDHINY
tara:strand:- start:509 stop:979 length:471 start_codon:yes stop_codon:yes gene_type:complete